MRIKVIILFLIAAGAAAATITFAKSWLQTQQNVLDAKFATMQPVEIESSVMVLVVKRNLPTGSFLNPEKLHWMPFPEEGVAESYYRQETEDQIAGANLEGAVVRSGMTAGEPVTRGRIVMPGDRGFLAAVLKAGKRAVSVPINATTGISGFIFPGDTVDIILTHTMEEKDFIRRASETILHDIRVLAVDQSLSDEKGEPVLAKTTTLEVTPKEAELIAVAMEIGRLSLVLRSLALTDSEEASVKDGEVKIIEKRSFTLDTQASQLIRGPKSAVGSNSKGVAVSNEDKVRIVRRGEETVVSVSRTSK